jgi:hypothetical protein
VVAANSSKPPARSWYPGSIDRPVLGVFFSRYPPSAQPQAGSHTIELAYADKETEALIQQALNCRTGDRRIALTMFLQKGEYFPTQLDWVPMSSIGQGSLPFALHPFEQAIHRHTVHRDYEALSRDLRRCSLLHLPDYFTLSCLALLWGHGGCIMVAPCPTGLFGSLLLHLLLAIQNFASSLNNRRV